MYGDPLVSISVKGSTETEFTAVSYVARVRTRGPTGPAAKTLATPIIESLKSTVREHAEVAALDLERLKTTFAIDVAIRAGVPEGYEALYTLAFTGRNVRASLALHDALTSIVGVESPTPTFQVNDAQGVQTRAFEDAVTKHRLKLADQLRALALDPAEFRLSHWSTQEEEPRGKGLALVGRGAEVSSVGLEPGKASLTLTVVFYYERLDPRPPVVAGG